MRNSTFSFFKFVKGGLIVLAVGGVLMANQPAKAASDRDVLVGIKTLSMLNGDLPSPLVMGIVYDPANAESKASAESIKAVLDRGVKTSEGEKVSGLLVPLSELGKSPKMSVAFVTPGVKDHFDAIGRMAAANNILTMTSDIDCVRANKCVLGIASKNVVEIYFSRAASEMAKVDFDSAFIMLIKKV